MDMFVQQRTNVHGQSHERRGKEESVPEDKPEPTPGATKDRPSRTPTKRPGRGPSDFITATQTPEGTSPRPATKNRRPKRGNSWHTAPSQTGNG